MYDPGQDTGGGDLYRPRADTNVRSGLRVTRRLRQCTAKQVARHTMAFALFLVRETLEAVTAGGVTGLTTSPAIRAPKHRKSARIDPAILSPPRFHNPYTTPARIPPASSYTVAGWMVFTSPLPKQHMYATFARIPISRIASAGWTILTSPVNEIASRCAAYALACLFNHSSKRGTQLSFAISALMMPTVTPKSATPRSTEKTQSEHSTTSQPDGEHARRRQPRRTAIHAADRISQDADDWPSDDHGSDFDTNKDDDEVERVEDPQNTAADDNKVPGAVYYYGHQNLTPELLRKGKPFSYHHYRYVVCKGRTAASRWVWRCCGRGTDGCTVQFKSDPDGKNIVWTSTVHSHAPRARDDKSASKCCHCRYEWKSTEDWRTHYLLTGHDKLQFECDFPECEKKCRCTSKMLDHLKEHYGANNGQQEHLDQYRGHGIPNPVLGLDDGNKCPDCKERIVCLSHYVWHMEHTHSVRGRSTVKIQHLRCTACCACIPMERARNHFQLFCPFTILPVLKQVFNSSDVDHRLTICNCKCSPVLPRDYPNPLKIWSTSMLNVPGHTAERNLSPFAQKFFLRQTTKNRRNDVYFIVEVDPRKSYTVVEFAGCVRYVGSCHDTKVRYGHGNDSFVTAPPTSSSKRLYVVPLCALVCGTAVHLFDDGDRLLLENFLVLHFGPHNLYNILYPMAAHTALMSEDFQEFAPASDEIVQALIEGTFEKVVRPRYWRKPQALLIEPNTRGRQRDTYVTKQSSEEEVARKAASASLAPTTPPAHVPAQSKNTIGNGEVPIMSTSQEPEPPSSQEYAARFDDLVKEYSSTKRIPVAVAASRLLRKTNITPIFLDNDCHDGPNTSGDVLSPASTDPSTSFISDFSAHSDEPVPFLEGHVPAPPFIEKDASSDREPSSEETVKRSPGCGQSDTPHAKIRKLETAGAATISDSDVPQSAKSDDSGVGLAFDFASTSNNGVSSPRANDNTRLVSIYSKKGVLVRKVDMQGDPLPLMDESSSSDSDLDSP